MKVIRVHFITTPYGERSENISVVVTCEWAWYAGVQGNLLTSEEYNEKPTLLGPLVYLGSLFNGV